VSISVALHWEDGTSVREARWPGNLDRSAELTIHPHMTLTRGAYVAFIPYVALDLPPGQHTLIARLRGSVRSPDRDGIEPLTAVGASSFAFAVDMPAVREVRFTVSRMQLQPGRYDDVNRNFMIGAAVTSGVGIVVLPRRRWQRPDPFWSVAVAGFTAFRSATRQDSIRPRWNRPTPWLPFAPGDTMQLYAEDRDLTLDQRLGAWTLDPSSLPSALSSDAHVRSLHVTGVRLRNRPTRVRRAR
jgi:hypothetical protein